MHHQMMDMQMWFAWLEVPFLLGAVVMAFLTARAMRGGVLGSGMAFIAWGLLVMAVGHIHMQVEHVTGTNIFQMLFGHVGGIIAWFTALIVTWLLTAMGFAKLYRASRPS